MECILVVLLLVIFACLCLYAPQVRSSYADGMRNRLWYLWESPGLEYGGVCTTDRYAYQAPRGKYDTTPRMVGWWMRSKAICETKRIQHIKDLKLN